MTSIHTFIISWAGQHANAAAIAGALAPSSGNVTIVYSDPDPEFAVDPRFDAVKRPNDLMFGDKFRACLERCRSDVLLLIHADCTCASWPELVKTCREAFDRFPEINVWAPTIDGTFYSVEATEITKLPENGLSVVAGTDAIVVAFRRETIDRFAAFDLKKNLHGWGVDWILICHSYANNMIAVVDRTTPVHHVKSRRYPRNVAWEQMTEFLEGLTPFEKTLYKLLRGYVEARKALNKDDKRKQRRRFRFW
jgi:hypothetical protein